MRKLLAGFIIILVMAVAYTPGYAETSPETLSETAAKAAGDDRLPILQQEKWQFFVSPYLWLFGLNVTTSSFKSADGTNVAWWDVASTLFSDSIGGMGRVEAWKGRWGLYLDGYFTYFGTSDSEVGFTREKIFGPVDFTKNKQIHLNGITVNVGIPGQLKGNITLIPSGSAKYISRIGSLDVGGRFLVGTWPLKAEKPLPVLSLELLGGLRFNSINQYLRIDLSNIKVGNASVDLRKFSLSGDHQTIKNGSYVIDYTLQFFEPLLGARLGLWLNKKLLLTLKGDVGGFGVVAYNNVTCDFEALLGYRFHKNIYAYTGYKARGTWLDLGEDLAQISFNGWVHGPVLGTTFIF
jgi:hypothetical protein